MADVLRHAYDEAICIKGGLNGGAHGVLICGGTLRGDSTYGPGRNCGIVSGAVVLRLAM